MHLKLAGGKKPTQLTTLPLKNTGNWAKGHEGKNTTYKGAERINARALIFLILNTIKMTKFQIYTSNVKSAYKSHLDGTWANKKSVYYFIFWYTVIFIKTQIIK